MRGLATANLGLRFLLELAALAAFALWGAAVGDGTTAWLLGIGAPLAAAAYWGLLVSPKAKVDLPRPLRFGVELLFFALAALALAGAGHPLLAVAFAGAALASGLLNYRHG